MYNEPIYDQLTPKHIHHNNHLGFYCNIIAIIMSFFVRVMSITNKSKFNSISQMVRKTIYNQNKKTLL